MQVVLIQQPQVVTPMQEAHNKVRKGVLAQVHMVQEVVQAYLPTHRLQALALATIQVVTQAADQAEAAVQVVAIPEVAEPELVVQVQVEPERELVAVVQGLEPVLALDQAQELVVEQAQVVAQELVAAVVQVQALELAPEQHALAVAACKQNSIP
jgi:hypothetical protein